jgi:hypothetical protein
MLVDYQPRSKVRGKRAGNLAAASMMLLLIPIIGLKTHNETVITLGITVAPLAGIALALGGLVIARRQPAGAIACAVALAANIIPALFGWLIFIHGIC